MQLQNIATVNVSSRLAFRNNFYVEWLEGRIDATRDQLVDAATDLLVALADATAALLPRI